MPETPARASFSSEALNDPAVLTGTYVPELQERVFRQAKAEPRRPVSSNRDAAVFVPNIDLDWLNPAIAQLRKLFPRNSKAIFDAFSKMVEEAKKADLVS